MSATEFRTAGRTTIPQYSVRKVENGAMFVEGSHWDTDKTHPEFYVNAWEATERVRELKKQCVTAEVVKRYVTTSGWETI